MPRKRCGYIQPGSGFKETVFVPIVCVSILYENFGTLLWQSANRHKIRYSTTTTWSPTATTGHPTATAWHQPPQWGSKLPHRHPHPLEFVFMHIKLTVDACQAGSHTSNTVSYSKLPQTPLNPPQICPKTTRVQVALKEAHHKKRSAVLEPTDTGASERYGRKEGGGSGDKRGHGGVAQRGRRSNGRRRVRPVYGRKEGGGNGDVRAETEGWAKVQMCREEKWVAGLDQRWVQCSF